jgi:spore coat protein A
MLMNGHVYPFLEVPPKRVRFRFLNPNQARFVNMVLLMDDGSADSITMDVDSFGNGIPAASVNPGPPMVMIGTEGGFLRNPVVIQQPDSTSAFYKPITLCPFIDLETVNPDGPFNLLLGPAERADLIVDFNGLAAGTKIIMYSDTPAPFPGGDQRNTYFPNNPNNPVSPQPGYGPNTRQLMQFRVVAGTGDSKKFDDWYKVLQTELPKAFDKSQPPFFVNGPTVSGGMINLPAGVPVRYLTLNETFDEWGRLIQMIGTNTQLRPGTFGRFYPDPPTEVPSRGDTEVWQIANLTGDTHPIHIHLVNAQILARQPFDANNYDGNITYLGDPFEPEAYEKGWKETFRMNPGEVMTLVMKFDLPKVPFLVPFSPRMRARGIPNGNEFVHHCHILEHEEHDMMRPLVVTGLNPIGF